MYIEIHNSTTGIYFMNQKKAEALPETGRASNEFYLSIVMILQKMF